MPTICTERLEATPFAPLPFAALDAAVAPLGGPSRSTTAKNATLAAATSVKAIAHRRQDHPRDGERVGAVDLEFRTRFVGSLRASESSCKGREFRHDRVRTSVGNAARGATIVSTTCVDSWRDETGRTVCLGRRPMPQSQRYSSRSSLFLSLAGASLFS